MYFWAAITFLVGFLPFGNLIAQFGYGLSGYFLYYRDSTAKISAVMSTYPGQNTRMILADTGGVHGWVKLVGILCFFLQPAWIFVVSLLFGGAFMMSFQQVLM